MDIDFYIDYYVKCKSTILNQNSHKNYSNHDFFQLMDFKNMNKISLVFS